MPPRDSCPPAFPACLDVSHKINPADSPILDLAVYSDTIPRSRLYDLCDSILGQKLSQVDGVGQL